MFTFPFALSTSLLFYVASASQEPQHAINLGALGNASTGIDGTQLLPSSQDIGELPCNSESCGNYYGQTNGTSRHWTHEPKCLKDDTTAQTFCVYTDARFANGRGISLFTTPLIAGKVLTLPAFTQPGLHDEVNLVNDQPWEVKFVPGRGNGLFATRTLNRGDLIISTTPLGIYMSDAFFPDFPLDYRYLHMSFDQLPKSSQEILMSSAAHYEGDPIMERINTNAFAGEFEGEPHFLLYPETAVCTFLAFCKSSTNNLSE